VLKDLTGMRNVFLEQIGAFGDPDRLSKEKDRIWLEAIRQKPDARVITVGFFALVNIKNYKIKPAGFAKHLMWADFKEVGEMGFDHNDILKAAIHRLRNNLYLKPVGFELLPEEFSLHQLYTLYNEIMDEEIDRRNFRRKMLHTGFLLETDNFQTGVPHKPARLYRFVKEEYENTAKENFKFF
jgi:8-oxo-dGTP diphosphatase